MNAYEKFGFKQLTSENWLEMDEVMLAFKRQIRDGSTTMPTGEDRVNEIYAYELNENVPLDVQKVFEVARGTMVYGYLFYPLYTLASDQLYRALETAVIKKCEIENAPKSKTKGYQKQIEWLTEAGFINKSETRVWEYGRIRRNSVSHLQKQHISLPVHAYSTLETAVKQINSLF